MNTTKSITTQRFVLANMQPEDVRFFNDLVALFCDPERAGLLAALKRGDAVLHFTPYGAGIFPVTSDN